MRLTSLDTLRKTITVTRQQNEWIKTQIESGNFTNYSEYIRDLVRRDQAQLLEIETTHSELVKGEKSGIPVSFDSEHFKMKLVAKHAGLSCRMPIIT